MASKRLRLTENEVVGYFAQTNAFLEGHFVYASGQHGITYLDKSKVLMYPTLMSALAFELAHRTIHLDADVVVGPVAGAVALSARVAEYLDGFSDKSTRSVYAERDKNGLYFLGRDFAQVVKGARVLIIEDVINSGFTASSVIDCVKNSGGQVVAAGCLWNRGGISSENLKVPELITLVNLRKESHDEADCPMCKLGLSVNTEYGHGKRFLETKKKTFKCD